MVLFNRILEILSALLTPIIAVIGVIILIYQYRLEKFKWRLALYDRRYEVYLAITQHLSNIMAIHNVSNEELFNFLRKTRDKEFLFGKEIHEFIDQIYLKSVDLYTV